jgi:nucleoside 2-deoxyribosyltransferase
MSRDGPGDVTDNNSTPKKKCFFIAPIGVAKSETRERSDEIFEVAIAPAARECGYEAKRGDHIDEPGRIVRQVVREILQSDLVIADLSYSNPNVMYELGIAHSQSRPLVQIIEEDQPLPFDVNQLRTLRYRLRPRSVLELRDKLVVSIKHVESNPGDVDSPVADALLRNKLDTVTDPVGKTIATLSDRLEALERWFGPRLEPTHRAQLPTPQGLVQAWCAVLEGRKGTTVGRAELMTALDLTPSTLERAVLDLVGWGVLRTVPGTTPEAFAVTDRAQLLAQ